MTALQISLLANATLFVLLVSIVCAFDFLSKRVERRLWEYDRQLTALRRMCMEEIDAARGRRLEWREEEDDADAWKRGGENGNWES